MPTRKKTVYDKRRYKKNRKRLLEQMAKYYRKNKKRKLKYNRKYYYENHGKILKQQQKYYRKNRKKALKQMAKYYHKNRRKFLEYSKEYNKKCGGTMKWRHMRMLIRHKRKLAPRGVTGKPMSIAEHQRKLYFADGRERLCWYCHGENNKCGSGLDRLDNTVTYTVKNTVPCCSGCNAWRGAVHTVQETRNHFKPMRDAAKGFKP